MNRNVSFIRKVAYVACIALLLFPLFYLGQPSTKETQGGVLAQMRAESGLTQSALGDIDPASETMKLSTLGLRPLAIALLWNDANRFKMKENWEQFSATVKQIVRLQPNFIKIWDFQAHNISYNVSVEFDNYKHRYHWVKKGFAFLTEGTHYNRDNPLLLARLGWFFGQKIGRSDEQRQFRRLFRADTDFHQTIAADLPEMAEHTADGLDGRPDNWLVGRLWNLRAQDAVDIKGKTLIGSSPLIFYSYTPMMRINYAKAIEEEGHLDERAAYTWQAASDEWRAFGEKDIPSSWGHNIRLGATSRLEEEAKVMRAKLDELVPGARAELYAEKLSKLSPEIRAAVEKPEDERLLEDISLIEFAGTRLKIFPDEIAKRAPPADQQRAKVLAARVKDAEDMALRTKNYGSTINYRYWATRCAVEQKRETVKARKHQFAAAEFQRKAELGDARKEFEQAWELWGGIIERYPELIEDVTGDELYESIQKYEEVLRQLGQPFPSDFKLKILRDYVLAKKGGKQPVLPKPVTDDVKPPETPSAEKRPEDKKPDDKDAKPADQKPADTKPEDSKPSDDKKPEEKKRDDNDPKPADPKPEPKSEEKKPDDNKPEKKPDEPKSADEKKPEDKDTKPADPKPAENKSADEKPADDKKPSENSSDEKKVDDKKPEDSKPADDKKPDEKKPDDTKPDNE